MLYHQPSILRLLSLKPVLCALLLCALGHAPRAQAECTNYENYLHWISSLTGIENPVEFVVQGSLVYIATTGSTPFLHTVDISDPNDPEIVGGGSIPAGLLHLAIDGAYGALLYSTDVYRLDLTNPLAPTWWGVQATSPDKTDLCVKGQYAYTSHASHNSRIQIHDMLRSPNDWTIRNRTGLTPRAICKNGVFLYAACVYSPWGGTGGLKVLALDTSAAIIGSYDDNALSPLDVAAAGDLAFMACGPDGLLIFDVSDPAVPTLVGTFNPDGCADRVTAEGNFCYLSCTDLGKTYVVDVSTPESPVEAGGLTPFGVCKDLSIAGSHLYMLIEDTGLDVIAVATPGGLDPIRVIDTGGTAEDVVYSDSRAPFLYVADGDSGIAVIDFANPLDPQLIASLDTPGYAWDIDISGSHVFVADGANGLQSVDVTVPTSPTLDAAEGSVGTAVDLQIVGSYAYVASQDSGLSIVDISSPATLFEVGSNDTLTAAQGVSVSGNYAYVADGVDGLKILDVTDPDNPWIIDEIKTRSMSELVAVTAVGTTVYASDADSSIYIIDVTDPRSVVVRSELRTRDRVHDLAVNGLHAYLANSDEGMQLVDVEQADQPLIVGGIDLASTSRGVFVTDDFAFVAADSAGLMVCKSQCGAYERVTADFAPDTTAAFLPATISFTDESLGYIINHDWDFGDGTGVSTEVNPTYTFTERGEYDVSLTVTGLDTIDTWTETIYVLSEPPLITTVTDVPQDQGGYVYVHFARSGYDDTQPNKSTEFYSVQRQDAGVWVNITTVGCYGALYYTALVNTQGDGESSWTTPFRVIAHMEEGIWIGPEVTGFSEDNIAPEAPLNVAWLADRHLGWDPVAATDFAYFRVYGSHRRTLDGAVSLATTVDTDVDLPDLSHPYVLVVAVDDAGLESAPSLPAAATDVPGLVAEVALSEPRPNPFNPSTTFEYALPAAGQAKLSIYDVAGRLVRVLIDEPVAAGLHTAEWRGRDAAGRSAPSGRYFGRLEAGGRTITRGMTLVK